MSEVPCGLSVLEGGDSLLADEIFPALMPCGECRSEGRLVGLRERMHEGKELLVCPRLGATREVSSDYLDLMELADLHWHTLKNLDESSPSVDHGRFQCPSSLRKDSPGIPIVRHELARYFMPPNILGQGPRAEDADAVVATPEGGVGDDNSQMWCKVLFRNRDCIDPFAHPDMRTLVLLGKLFERLFLFDVFFPELCVDSCISFR